MDARVILKPETAHQESNALRVLRWMQAHPNAMFDTNITAMSQQITGFSTAISIAQAIEKLLKKGLLDRSGNKRRADFYINYYHPQMPPEILENAPEGVKEAIAHNLEVMKEETLPAPEEIVANTIEKEAVVEPEPVVQTVPVEIPVEVSTKDGEKKISITINLNLNI